ncbi:unnamed protein product, partial [Symbiodinium pilosum]
AGREGRAAVVTAQTAPSKGSARWEVANALTAMKSVRVLHILPGSQLSEHIREPDATKEHPSVSKNQGADAKAPAVPATVTTDAS